jgi:hypothetical protein
MWQIPVDFLRQNRGFWGSQFFSPWGALFFAKFGDFFFPEIRGPDTGPPKFEKIGFFDPNPGDSEGVFERK